MFIPKDKIEEVLTRFNNYHDRLQFTYEIENEHNSINFLNLTIIKNEDNFIKTNWFRKNTYCGRFINYFSNHPLQHKIGIIKNLVDSAILLAEKSFHNENLDIIKNYSELNNYPKIWTIITKHINKRIIELNERITKPQQNIDIVNKKRQNNHNSLLWYYF